MVPTDCLMIQEPLVTRGMSLKVLLRRACASLLSPPARNLPIAPMTVSPKRHTYQGRHTHQRGERLCTPSSNEKGTEAAHDVYHRPGRRLTDLLPPCRVLKAHWTTDPGAHSARGSIHLWMLHAGWGHLARERSKGESRSALRPLSLPSSRLRDMLPLASRGVGPTDMLPLPCLHRQPRWSSRCLQATTVS